MFAIRDKKNKQTCMFRPKTYLSQKKLPEQHSACLVHFPCLTLPLHSTTSLYDYAVAVHYTGLDALINNSIFVTLSNSVTLKVYWQVDKDRGFQATRTWGWGLVEESETLWNIILLWISYFNISMFVGDRGFLVTDTWGDSRVDIYGSKRFF